ncbi:MAG: mercury(II) reductase [Nitrososphaera sp.]|jgi:mercuric reductase
MRHSEYDLVILGGGAAAFAAAIKASEMDATVAMIAGGTIGGTCVNVGCVPSKNLLSIGELFYECAKNRLNEKFPIDGFSDFRKIIENKNDLVLTLRKQKYVDVLGSMPNTELIQGHAKFRSKNEVVVNGQTLKAKKFIIATGSSPMIPPINGMENVDYLTNVEALDLKERPDSMIIVGGSTLGVEFAQMYSRFGTKVTLLQRGERIIPKEEPEISELLKQYLEEEGVGVYTGLKFQDVRKESDLIKIKAMQGGREVEFEAQQLLLATGRKPNTADLSLESAGIAVRENGAVFVNDEMMTSNQDVFAAGDVTGEPMLETVAAKEGAIAASNALFGTKKSMDFNSVPHAVFTSPQVASVGITEKTAMEKYGTCVCRTLLMKDVPKAVIVNKTKGMIKMVVEPSTQKILGVHIISSMAADIIHEATIAVKQGLTVDDIVDTTHVFPTMSESIKLVATSFKKDLKRLSCCVE